ncbi:MAG: phage/plasmid primase, P4 family [Desulfobacterales bacterium]|nr:phage/plasmid primase, P4 family [Desulfobacterales bacterium]
MGDVVSIDAIKQETERRAKEMEKEDSGGGSGQEIDSKFILKCLRQNELGDGELFKKLYRDDFIFNKSMDAWMAWNGHHWEVDKMDRALASVEGVAKVYQDEAKRVSKKINDLEAKNESSGHLKSLRDQLNKRVSSLRSSRRRKNCITFAHTSGDPIAIEGYEVDQMPWLMACKNGVVNLKTGEIEPGRQKDYLLTASQVEWPADGVESQCPVWENFLLEIMDDKQDLVDFLQRLIGLGMVGKVIEGFFVVLSGRGRNGKGTMVETITKIMGSMAGAIRSEMLLDQGRIASSAGPTPDIMALRGRRFVFASETDQNCRISPSRVKWLTGNDTLSGRNPNDKYEVNFRPTHSMWLQTNNDPHAPADDYAFWERMIKFPFNLSFVNRPPKEEFERKADPELPEKLEAEHPMILAWMVKGCLQYQKMGLQRPAAVKQAVEKYKQEEDIIGDFIRECCIVGPNYHVGATKVYDVFVTWWHKNVSNKEPKMRRFGTLFGKRFKKSKSGTVSYHGVGLLSDLDDSDHTRTIFQD